MTDDRIKELAATLRNPRRWQVEELLRKAVDEALHATRPEALPLKRAAELLRDLAEQQRAGCCDDGSTKFGCEDCPHVLTVCQRDYDELIAVASALSPLVEPGPKDG